VLSQDNMLIESKVKDNDDIIYSTNLALLLPMGNFMDEFQGMDDPVFEGTVTKEICSTIVSMFGKYEVTNEDTIGIKKKQQRLKFKFSKNAETLTVPLNVTKGDRNAHSEVFKYVFKPIVSFVNFCTSDKECLMKFKFYQNQCLENSSRKTTKLLKGY